MSTIKNPLDEAKSMLSDKLLHIHKKTDYLHKVIDSVSCVSITHAESILKEADKKDFFSEYIKVCQEVEGSLGKLFILLDTAVSLGVLEGTMENIVVESDLTVNKQNRQTLQAVIGNNTDSFTNVMEKSGDNAKKMLMPKKGGQKKKYTKYRHRKISCHLCRKVSRGYGKHKIHFASCHPSEFKSDFKLVCRFCATDNPDRHENGNRLSQHVNTVHVDIRKKHICSLCGVGFDRPGKRDKHQLYYCSKMTVPENASENRHICTLCGIGFSNHDSLDQHKDHCDGIDMDLFCDNDVY